MVAVRPVAPRGDVKGHQQRHHAVGVMYGLAVQRRLLATYKLALLLCTKTQETEELNNNSSSFSLTNKYNRLTVFLGI